MTDYDLLVGSLRVLKRPHLEECAGEELGLVADESGPVSPPASGDDVADRLTTTQLSAGEVGSAGSDVERDTLLTAGTGDYKGGGLVRTQESDSEPEETGGPAAQIEDPFCRHFGRDLTEGEVAELVEVALSTPLHYEQGVVRKRMRCTCATYSLSHPRRSRTQHWGQYTRLSACHHTTKPSIMKADFSPTYA